MSNRQSDKTPGTVQTLGDLAGLVDYSLMDTLAPDPQAEASGMEHQPRQVFSGHYVPVKPTPIKHPEYVAHSSTFFRELGFDDSLAHTEAFKRLFSGDLSQVPAPMRKVGWATGYALSIYGTEYTQQCPFQTGNGYGDGRAISVLEAVINGKRWEMQLKGAGRTPYCRGADGRTVLRSSVREFLAQEHMHGLGVPTSRSLCLFVSQSETVDRPWYRQGSDSFDPDIMGANPVAISTRVAPSFLRIGQLELFGRRARSKAHPSALQELEAIALHLIQREYSGEVDKSLSTADQLIQLALAFRDRLISLVADWIRVGYCQGNFNSDNCAGGGFTLDYGPFGFCERFEPMYQPWTGGGRHFSFLNQPTAAEKNFEMFCRSLAPLLAQEPGKRQELDSIRSGFSTLMQQKMERMWASKLGLEVFDSELVISLLQLMVQTSVDYTIFFRELSGIPADLSGVSKSFYMPPTEELSTQWNKWLKAWREQIEKQGDRQGTSIKMKRVNPKYSWREWLIVPAYRQAEKGNYALIEELQQVLTRPYDEQSAEVESKYYRLRPAEYFRAGGISHYSCSS
ncbi:protein adenylyltransferase SelO [Bowmanella dokdonensis]|uniref:Protein nucleotidyltransferase YdiU n=1 Tax=Bowmanella dokdonensis TaxID=751969 RepID=A0A939DL68_9ALTE|nr:protein adenylyltransferase SelO family protein [Bowmanella dokdonensis]MBN7823896.1 YdiU family protein [Bowmanella dokdonensis]